MEEQPSPHPLEKHQAQDNQQQVATQEPPPQEQPVAAKEPEHAPAAAERPATQTPPAAHHAEQPAGAAPAQATAPEATAPEAAAPQATAPQNDEPQTDERHAAAAPKPPAEHAAPHPSQAAEPQAAAAGGEQPATAEPQAAARQDEPGAKQDFATILAEFEEQKTGGQDEAAGGAAAVPATPNIGQKVSGKVISITDEQVFVDLGTKSEGMIEAAQLRDAEGKLTVAIGDALDATVTAIDPESGVIVLRKRASGRGGHQEVANELRQAFQYGMPVEGLVTGINKGGAEVQAYGMRAFCPLSQLDLRYVESPQQFIGQRLKFKVARIEEGGRNRRPDIVLSRRALLEEEAQAKAAELRSRLKVGAVLKGRVTSLTTYGAFIDLGGLEGLLHVSEIGYSRLADPKEALAVGQEVEVQVIKIEKGKDEKRPERISLSRRALERDPWRDAADRFAEGSILPGRVMRLESFGAFVELAPGLEGLVHVSELGAGRRLSHAREAVQIGQDVRVRVLNVDPVKRRISLSMALTDEHEPVEEQAPREAAAAGQQPVGGFGSLGDFFKSSRRK